MRFPRMASLWLGLLAAGSAPVPAVAGTPLIVAVDVSRSLTETELSTAGRLLVQVVTALPAVVPVGLLEFADTPHWRVPLDGERQEVASALDRLAPSGQHTLLNDALFLAAQELPAGGVVLAATDGRDENSATTVDDVARVCTANRVRLILLATGHQVNERALRRLALLTGGAFLTPGETPEPNAVVAAVQAAQQGIAAELAKAAVESPTPATVESKAIPAPVLEPSGKGSPIPLALILAAAVLAAIVALILWRRQRAEERRTCPHCGSPLEPWETDCVACRLRDLQAVEKAQAAAAARLGGEALLDAEAFAKQPIEEAIDKTFVLGEQFVLLVKEHRKAPRTCVLEPDKPFSVGRAPRVNTLTLTDPTLSAQHFRVVFSNGTYYIADLGTTNGTYVNGEKVHASRLKVGDTIRAGEVEFEVRVQLQKRN